MRARLVPALFVAAGLGLIGTGSAFAYADAPAVATPADAPPAATGDPLSGTRNNLQQAGLPLALLGGGVGQLTDGSRQLDDGAHQLADGLAQASAGGQQLADGLGQLQGGVGLLGDGATQVSDGVDQVVDRLTGFGEMQAGVTEQLTVVAGTLRQSPDPVSQEAAARLDGLVGRLNTEGLGPETLAQLEQLRGGARQLAYELSDPDAQFVAGMVQAADGSRQLRDGLMLLDDGGRQLVDGTGQLVDGVGPVTGVIDGVSDNVREATAALPKSPAPASSGDVGAAVETTAERQWWPYALVALGALVLAVPALLPNVLRPNVTRVRSN
ncbi:hypothetical protein [Rhodococcus aetherivorans]|uniref:hypothetical protein n=1 Tax=Rhodococcus aetherivorans TaxID=191292 RepID=UPI00365A4E49